MSNNLHEHKYSFHAAAPVRPTGKSGIMSAATHDRLTSLRVLSIPGARHAQNSLFPLLWQALQRAGLEMVSARSTSALTLRFDILHVHLPEVLVEKPLHRALAIGTLFLAYVALARTAGKKVVWTIHEVTPSLKYPLTLCFLKCMRAMTNAYVFMNRTSESEFLRRYPSQRHKVLWRVPHSSYPTTKISEANCEDIRRSLTGGLDCMLVGYLGEIRPYKNPTVLQFLPEFDVNGRPLRIVAAGKYHSSCNVDAVEATFRKIGSTRLLRIEERLSDERLAELVQTIDLTILPYLRGWNSGFAMFVLANGGRLLCSDLPMFRELAEEVGAPWIYLFDHNATDLSKELAGAMSRISVEKPNSADQDRLQRFLTASSFDVTAARQAELYDNLTARDAR
jgi:beta-1,4-mannosyltransferase